MNAISQTTFSNEFSSMEIYEFWLKFHSSLFLGVQLTTFHHWLDWRRPGDKPLSEPMMVSVPAHICVTQWVKLVSHVQDNMLIYVWGVLYFILHVPGWCVLHHNKPFLNIEFRIRKYRLCLSVSLKYPGMSPWLSTRFTSVVTINRSLHSYTRAISLFPHNYHNMRHREAGCFQGFLAV